MKASRLIEEATSHRLRWRQFVLSAHGPKRVEVGGRMVKAGTQRFVASALATYMSPDGECWPGLDMLAVDTALSKSTVVLAVRALEQTGWLHRRRGGGTKHPTRYQGFIPPAAIEEAREAAVKGDGVAVIP